VKVLKTIMNLMLILAMLGLAITPELDAQTFTTLHSFSAGFYNSDGASPQAGLISSGNTLYGTTYFGGSYYSGIVFAVNTDGTGFTNLLTFTFGPNTYHASSYLVPGQHPNGLILSGNTLYGTAESGGTNDSGTVFAVNTDGTDFTNMHTFSGSSDGANPYGSLILLGSTLYGTASQGGSSNAGTIFAINTKGMGFTNLYSFTGGSDGASPQAGLISSGNTLYGTTFSGGSSNAGTVFAINTDGTDFTNLYSFTGGSDGANPYAGLILSGDTLYGTTYFGGTVFAINTNGTDFTTLHNFIRSDGADPCARLVLSGNTLYGTTARGGYSGGGTVFAVNTNGMGFTNLYSFDYFNPLFFGGENALILSGNTLYGTTIGGGGANNGTVFILSFAPQLAIIPYGGDVILTWPTNSVAGFDYSGFTLQSTTNLFPAAWNTVSPGPIVIGGQDVVINSISGAQQFYRLSQSPP
jgi:uncharacterized repeat protein (TIGR03803 family)